MRDCRTGVAWPGVATTQGEEFSPDFKVCESTKTHIRCNNVLYLAKHPKLSLESSEIYPESAGMCV